MRDLDFKHMVETLPVAFLRSDANGRIVVANAEAKRLLGSDLVGKNATDLYGPSSGSRRVTPESVKSALISARESRITNISIPIKLANGCVRELLCAFYWDEETDAVDGLIISGIFELNRSLAQIAESMTKSYRLEDTLSVITDEALKLSKAQRAYIKLYDAEKDMLTFSALSSANPIDRLPSGSSPATRGMTGFAFRKQRLYRSANVRREKPGLYYSIFPDTVSKVVVPLLFNERRVDATFKCYGVLSVDGTEENQFGIETEEALTALAKHAAIAIAQSRLIQEVQSSYEQLLSEIRYARDAIGAGNLLHDGKNMVRDAIDEIEAIQRELGDVTLYKRKAKELQKRLNGLRDLRDLMRDLLEQLRVPSKGESALVHEGPADLGDLVRRVINIIPIGDAPIEIENVSNDRVYPVYGEPTRILLVLYNLVTNAVTAIKRSDRPGRITLQASNTPNEAELRRVVIHDNGPGLTRQVLDFIRKSKEYSSVPGGSGLGLLTVRETVRDLGGNITVDSKFGSYTKFTIDIPGPPEDEDDD